MLTKVCTKCKVEKLKESFGNHTRAVDGLNCWCKECKAVADKNYLVNNKDKVVAQRAEYYKNNSQQIKMQHKIYADRNKEKRKVYASKWRQESGYMSDYRLLNKEHISQYNKKYQTENKDRFNAKNAKRKATKLQSTPDWVDLKVVMALYRIAAELTSLGIPTHVDHIVPLQSDTVCGLHCEDNLQLLSASDNMSKGNRHWPDIW